MSSLFIQTSRGLGRVDEAFHKVKPDGILFALRKLMSQVLLTIWVTADIVASFIKIDHDALILP